MKSVTERRYINGRKYTKAEREAAELSIAFLTAKYECSRKFFQVLGRLKLADLTVLRHSIFGAIYLADKLTQRHTFGKYDGTRPERGARNIDPNSICNCPTWFSKPMEVDNH